MVKINLDCSKDNDEPFVVDVGALPTPAEIDEALEALDKGEKMYLENVVTDKKRPFLRVDIPEPQLQTIRSTLTKMRGV